MGKLVTKEIRKIYKDYIDQIITDLGECVYVYGESQKADCPNCHYDRVTKKSKNIYDTSFVAPVEIFGETINPKLFNRGRCPVCKGDGKLLNLQPETIQAKVKWIRSDAEMEKTVAGDEGTNIARVKSRVCTYETFRDCKYAIIDGVRCELDRPPVIRGLGMQDEMVISFFQAVEVGHSVKD